MLSALRRMIPVARSTSYSSLSRGEKTSACMPDIACIQTWPRALRLSLFLSRTMNQPHQQCRSKTRHACAGATRAKGSQDLAPVSAERALFVLPNPDGRCRSVPRLPEGEVTKVTSNHESSQ